MSNSTTKRGPSATQGSTATLPVIDFSKCGLLVECPEDVDQEAYKSVGTELYQAFRSHGFAYIENAGITKKALDDGTEAVSEFFGLPLEKKNEYAKQKSNFGYDPANVTGKRYGVPILHESFRAISKSVDDQWPDIPHLKERCNYLAEVCRLLAVRILTALGAGMKLKDKDHLTKIHSLMNQEGNLSGLKFIRYPASKPGDGPIRYNEHTDFGALTLLFQDDVGGLQVRNPDGSFVDAEPIPGTIVVNTADVFQVMSGERLKSTVHRVMKPEDPAKRSRPRNVIAYFAIPNHHVLMDPLEFKEEDGLGHAKRNPNPKTVFEHVMQRFREVYYPEGQ